MARTVRRSDEEWRRKLPTDVYRVTRLGATEPPFRNPYWNCTTPGIYVCVCCRQPLFSSEHKYDSGSGWPSFWRPLEGARIGRHEDHSLGMTRTEVRCADCDAHLGHVFPDGPPPTGERYCINALALRLVPERS